MKYLVSIGKSPTLYCSLNRHSKTNKALYYNNGYVEERGKFAII